MWGRGAGGAAVGGAAAAGPHGPRPARAGGRTGRDAVRLSTSRRGAKLKLADFGGSAGRLAWAQANRCPWRRRRVASLL